MVQPTERERGRAVVVALLQADTITLHKRGAVNLVLPVGGLRQDIGTVQVLVGLQLCLRAVAIHRRVGRGTIVGIFIGRPIHISPLVGIEQVETALIGLEREGSVEGDVGLALLGALGGDDDDTIGSLCTIDRSRGSVLEHLDALNVVAAENGTDVFARHHSVNHIERAVGIASEGGGSADGGVGAQTAGRTIGRDVHTRHAALQRLDDIARRRIGDVLHLHHGDRTRQVRFLLRGVTSDNHFVDHAVVLERDGHIGGSLHRGRTISYIRYDEVTPLGNYDGKLTIKIGGGGIRPFRGRDNVGTNQRFGIGGGNHDALHCDVLCLGGYCKEKQQ